VLEFAAFSGVVLVAVASFEGLGLVGGAAATGVVLLLVAFVGAMRHD